MNEEEWARARKELDLEDDEFHRDIIKVSQIMVIAAFIVMLTWGVVAFIGLP